MGTVFVVDDDADVVELITAILGQEGYRTAGFTSALAAREAVFREQPDMVLIDLFMPEMSGTELCRQIKSKELKRSVQVAFLSGDGLLEREASQAGADGFLSKPFNIEELLGLVESHVRAS